jgi:hypothetical protein
MFECPVCEFIGLEVKPYATWPPPNGMPITPPYVDWLGEASYEVCPMCEFEFGHDDDPGEGADPMSFAEYRADWESMGCPVAQPADVARINATRATPEDEAPE